MRLVEKFWQILAIVMVLPQPFLFLVLRRDQVGCLKNVEENDAFMSFSCSFLRILCTFRIFEVFQVQNFFILQNGSV